MTASESCSKAHRSIMMSSYNSIGGNPERSASDRKIANAMFQIFRKGQARKTEARSRSRLSPDRWNARGADFPSRLIGGDRKAATAAATNRSGRFGIPARPTVSSVSTASRSSGVKRPGVAGSSSGPINRELPPVPGLSQPGRLARPDRPMA